MSLQHLISGHDQFKKAFEQQHRGWLRLVEKGQHPGILWIGCSDSRIIPEQITGARPGELFVMRNVGNVVPPYGTTGDAAAAVLEFAVLELAVEHIIVCGHSHCGGIEAILGQGGQNTTSHLARWVSWIQPAVSQVEARGVAQETRWLETCKANVLLQCSNVMSYPAVSQANREGRLTVHGWLFDLESGSLLAYDDQSAMWRQVVSEPEVGETSQEKVMGTEGSPQPA
jgi:carbonic anhydrase